MNPESQSLPRSVLAALCAVVLAVSMMLPMLGATSAYAEEEVSPPVAESVTGGEVNDVKGVSDAESTDKATPPAEVSKEGVDAGTALPSGSDSETQPPANKASETYTVTFGNNEPQTVAPGAKATAPAMADTTLSINGKNVPATFAGWYQTVAADTFIPVEFSGDTRFWENDLIDRSWELKSLFVNDRQRAQLSVYPASSSIPIDGDTSFWALYEVPAHVISLGIYEEGHFGMFFPVRVIKGDPLISDAGWKWRADGFTIEKWSFVGEPFDVNTTPITEDLVIMGTGADGWAKSMVKVYLTKNPSGNSLGVSGSTGISVSGNLTGSNIPENASISLGATAITSGESYNALMGKVGNGPLAGVYEVSLAANGSLVHDEFGTLTLTFPIDAAYNGREIIVHHRHSDGSITSERVIAENGAVTVTVTDLSTFALEVSELTEVNPLDTTATADSSSSKLAQTGDPVSGLTLLGAAVASGAALAFVGYRSRKQTQK